MRWGLIAVVGIVACGAGGAPAMTPAASPRVVPGAAVATKAPWAGGDPRAWVERVGDAERQRETMVRLGTMLTGGERAEHADEAIAMLAKGYVDGRWDAVTGREVLELLAETGSTAATPALTKVLREAGGDRARSRTADVGVAARGAARIVMRGSGIDDALAEALWEAFAAHAEMPFSLTEHVGFRRGDAVSDAVAVVKHASYGPKALAWLEAPTRAFEIPGRRPDRIGKHAWAARVLGDLRYTAAVPALVAALLTPELRPISFYVQGALGGMPTAAEPELVAALTGTGRFGALAAAYPDRDDVPMVASALADIGREAGRDAVVEALGRTTVDDHRAELAELLPRFPADARATASFRRAYEKLPVGSRMRRYPVRRRGLALRRASRFFDPSLTPWLVKQVEQARGTDDALEVAEAGLGAAIELMTAEQVGLVEPAVKAMGTNALRASYAAGAAAALRCKADRNCWVATLGTSALASASPETEYAKAVCALASEPDAATKSTLAGALDRVATTSALWVLLEALRRLSPEGDAALAGRLDALASKLVGPNPSPTQPHVYDAMMLAEAAATLRARIP